MTIDNLQDIYGMAIQGITFGFAFSSLPFLIGWIVNFTMGLFRHAG